MKIALMTGLGKIIQDSFWGPLVGARPFRAAMWLGD
jgi:hypothetical protein